MDLEALGGYTVAREIGRGAAGRVLLAHDPRSGSDVVVRTIDAVAALPEPERARARDLVLAEASAAAAARHPGLAAILDVGEQDGVPFVVTELLAGEPLDRFRAPGSLLESRAVVAMIAGIADALGSAHAAGVVHGHVKPSKIHRAGPHAAQLRDLGLGSLAAIVASVAGAVPEVPDYWAPEQVKGGPVDGRTDLFALAVVLFESLVGERPFAGDSVASVLFRIVHEQPRDPGLHADRVSPALARFLRKALSKNPDQRFPDAATFAAELRRAAEEDAPADRPSAAVAHPEPTSRLSPSPPRRSLLPFVIAAAVVVALAAVVVGFLARGGGAPATPQTFRVTVVTEPENAAVTWNGRPVAGGRIELPAAGPYGTLAASHGCRTTTHDPSPADAGRTVTLVLDPERAPVAVDAGVAGAAMRVNGQPAGASPRQVELDLCRENVIEASAEGYRSASIVVPSGATPLEASRALASLRLEAIPRGRLLLPKSPVRVAFYVDGKRVARTEEGVDLPAGDHDVRAVNEGAWIDVRARVGVEAGRTTAAEIEIPPLGRLVVQAFPSNAKVSLRRGKGGWVFLDEVPLEKMIAAGRYRVRVEFVPTGETQERDVVLRAGQTARLRFSFGVRR